MTTTMVRADLPAPACLGAPPDMFFPGRGDPVEPAKAVCATCPAARREACLDEALLYGIKFGVWGGTSEKERRRLRRERGIKVIDRRTLIGADA